MNVIAKNDKHKLLQDYHGYLLRLQRTDRRSLYQLHRLALCREVAREYGLTDRQIKKLARQYRREQKCEGSRL